MSASTMKVVESGGEVGSVFCGCALFMWHRIFGPGVCAVYAGFLEDIIMTFIICTKHACPGVIYGVAMLKSKEISLCTVHQPEQMGNRPYRVEKQ